MSWKDWWRGYSDADIESARKKIMKEWSSGEWIEVTKKQHRAILGENMWSEYAVVKYKRELEGGNHEYFMQNWTA